jgi:hypothetical protein
VFEQRGTAILAVFEQPGMAILAVFEQRGMAILAVLVIKAEKVQKSSSNAASSS